MDPGDNTKQKNSQFNFLKKADWDGGACRRSVPVCRLYEPLVALRSNVGGGPTILKEEFLVHSTQPDLTNVEQNFWRLDSRSIKMFRSKPERGSIPADSIIHLSEISSIESVSDRRFNFVIRTRNNSTFFVIVPDLDRYQNEFGINLTSSWETHIRLVRVSTKNIDFQYFNSSI